jgi:hypothetical protein
MGLSPFKKSSFSSYDKTDNCYVAPPVPPNPDPKKFEILSTLRIGDFLIIEVSYPDCTNYEGRKLLVYEVDDAWTLLCKNNGTLDPHFSNNPKFYSPIARFEPTTRGWKMAKCFLRAYIKTL